ncbi:MAG: tRNA (N(6)-L-threonylcarbamoyladenosine(37)-C(2))-methylthiotransferase MtaB [Nitrospirae bacterium]|nr:tRNA (N(6)-L-threonylcarbamoyladenosine(37)-C(2))-methylthiotransferase MtaB [Nitrospirota bacterium]
MPRIAFSTLGCKINQYDTAVMKSSVTEGDEYSVVSFDDEADIYVINTCTVTGKSDSESRRQVRRALKRNRNARIVVTGCYAQTNPQEVAEIPGVSSVLGNNEKVILKDYLGHDPGSSSGRSSDIHVSDILETKSMHMSAINGFQGRSRAILKIQDGCNSRCSYCIVPFARGVSRSLSPDELIQQAALLWRKNYMEIVLSGVHLGGYGRDLFPGTSLPAVIRRILSETGIKRIRLSSIEPREITDELIELMAGESRICKHLHIPLQSGDNYILRSMNRNYDSWFYEDLIAKIRDKIHDAGIGCDVMAGYPGEEDRHFENTYRLIERLPLTYLHVFAYSPREGTSAFRNGETVTGDVKAERSEILRRLGEDKNMMFKKAHIGRIVDVLVEDDRDDMSGMMKGYTGNYLRVLIKGGRSAMTEVEGVTNRIVSVKVTGIKGSSLSGSLRG